jgi:hypothetical protein
MWHGAIKGWTMRPSSDRQGRPYRVSVDFVKGSAAISQCRCDAPNVGAKPGAQQQDAQQQEMVARIE